MALPDFLVAGVLRAGTTWLYCQMSKHPDICLGKHRKEIRYFDKYFSRGMRWYESYFSHCRSEQVIGEVAPTYIFNENSPERIYNVIPNVKIIIILRNPVKRAYSQYKKAVIDSGFRGSFSDFLNEYRGVIKRGLYYQQIQRFLDYFSREAIKIVIFEEMIDKPEIILKGIFRFLGVNDSYIPPGIMKNVNPSKIPRFHSFYIFLRKIIDKIHDYDLSWIVSLLKKFKFKRIFYAGRNSNSFKKIREKDQRYLMDYYEKDIENLSDFLGKDMKKYWEV